MNAASDLCCTSLSVCASLVVGRVPITAFGRIVETTLASNAKEVSFMVAPPLHDVINAPVKHIALQLVFYAVPRAPVCHPKDLFGSRQDGPIPTLLASVSKTKGCPYSGKAKTSAMTKHCRKCVKAFWQSSVHSKGVFFVIRCCDYIRGCSRMHRCS